MSVEASEEVRALGSFLSQLSTRFGQSQQTKGDLQFLHHELTRVVNVLGGAPDEEKKRSESRKKKRDDQKKTEEGPQSGQQKEQDEGSPSHANEPSEQASSTVEEEDDSTNPKGGSGTATEVDSSTASGTSEEVEDVPSHFTTLYDTSTIDRILRTSAEHRQALQQTTADMKEAFEWIREFDGRFVKTEKRLSQLDDLQGKKLRMLDMSIEESMDRLVEREMKSLYERIASLEAQVQHSNDPFTVLSPEELQFLKLQRAMRFNTILHMKEVESRITEDHGNSSVEKEDIERHHLAVQSLELLLDLDNRLIAAGDELLKNRGRRPVSASAPAAPEPSTSSTTLNPDTSTFEPTPPSQHHHTFSSHFTVEPKDIPPHSDAETSSSITAMPAPLHGAEQPEESHEGGDTTSKSKKKKKKGKKGSTASTTATTGAEEKEKDAERPAASSHTEQSPVASTSAQVDSPPQQPRPSTPPAPLNESLTTPETPPSPATTTTHNPEETNTSHTETSKKKGKKNKKGKGKVEEHADASAPTGLSASVEAAGKALV